MADWRGANSLITLKQQLDVAYPGWLYLGMKGDDAHAKVPSDHNPNAQGVVTAMDIGPGGGLDIHALADRIVANPHPDLKYVISDRRIAEWQNGFKWKPYNGSDPHDTHIHVSVGRGPDGQSKQPYDDTVKWNITGEVNTMPNKEWLQVQYRMYYGTREVPNDWVDSYMKSGKNIFKITQEMADWALANNRAHENTIDRLQYATDELVSQKPTSGATARQIASEQAINAIKDALSK